MGILYVPIETALLMEHTQIVGEQKKLSKHLLIELILSQHQFFIHLITLN